MWFYFSLNNDNILFFHTTLVFWQNVLPTSLPPGLMVIEKVISPEEERRMLGSIDWTGDEDAQNGEQSHRNADFPYALFSSSVSLQEDYILLNVLFEIVLSILVLYCKW